jgi:hypothetical protein
MTATPETLARPASFGNAATRAHHTAIPGARAAGQPRSADRGRGDPGHLGRARRARVLPSAPAWVMAVEEFVIAATITALVLVPQEDPGAGLPLRLADTWS